MMNQAQIAEYIAREAHRGQTRKFGEDKGKPYIVHPERIASKFKSNTSYCATAWLHDVIKDTDVGFADLINHGIEPSVASVVQCLSKREGENYFDFIMRIRRNPKAVAIKIADIKDNLSSCKEGSLKDKYRLALYILENCNE